MVSKIEMGMFGERVRAGGLVDFFVKRERSGMKWKVEELV
jgi:hypothetical protein